MKYSIIEKSELIALLKLEHYNQSKLLKNEVKDKRFLLLLDLIKKNKMQSMIISKIA